MRDSEMKIGCGRARGAARRRAVAGTRDTGARAGSCAPERIRTARCQRLPRSALLTAPLACTSRWRNNSQCQLEMTTQLLWFVILMLLPLVRSGCRTDLDCEQPGTHSGSLYEALAWQ